MTLCELASDIEKLPPSKRFNNTLTHQDCRQRCAIEDKLYAILFVSKQEFCQIFFLYLKARNSLDYVQQETKERDQTINLHLFY